jgi:hypothetical protein
MDCTTQLMAFLQVTEWSFSWRLATTRKARLRELLLDIVQRPEFN